MASSIIHSVQQRVASIVVNEETKEQRIRELTVYLKNLC